MIYILKRTLSKNLLSLLKSPHNLTINIRCASNLNLNIIKKVKSREDELLEKHADDVFYSSYMENNRLKLGYKRNTAIMQMILKNQEKKAMELALVEPLPIALQYLGYDDMTKSLPEQSVKTEQVSENVPTQFPYQTTIEPVEKEIDTIQDIQEAPTNIIEAEVKMRMDISNTSKDWMMDYENFSDYSERAYEEINSSINYGTPDISIPTSDVPCGGCGAYLHCKDTSIPGYIPSEIFKNHNTIGGTSLKEIICQRCYFLKNHNLALQVRVSPNDYPKILYSISNKKKALVVLIVDLLDFPCSIWPGIGDLIGYGKPIFIVGNKVDLLPLDGKGCLERVKKNLENSVRYAGFGTANIKHVALISAQTGYGVEDLITSIHKKWGYRGDVYLIGCTNVGKSSLFNALIQSDLCKSKASDLIQRATTSPWPGTTLNLLKFPILRMNEHRINVRMKRLMAAWKLEQAERKLILENCRRTKSRKNVSLMGYINQTFKQVQSENQGSDIFATNPSPHSRCQNKIGINEKDKEYIYSKWCYDTPGVVQEDQIIHLLTAEELILTLSRNRIVPETFSLAPGSTIFIGGLARLDFLEGDRNVRFTVFRSSDLPITICRTSQAEKIYEDFLGTDVFVVPVGNKDRLKLFPKLQPSKKFDIVGIEENFSCADLVLSSAGWIAITPKYHRECVVQGWTPEKRGIYLRDSLLRHSVALRGKKIRHSCAYRSNRAYLR